MLAHCVESKQDQVSVCVEGGSKLAQVQLKKAETRKPPQEGWTTDTWSEYTMNPTQTRLVSSENRSDRRAACLKRLRICVTNKRIEVVLRWNSGPVGSVLTDQRRSKDPQGGTTLLEIRHYTQFRTILLVRMCNGTIKTSLGRFEFPTHTCQGD